MPNWITWAVFHNWDKNWFWIIYSKYKMIHYNFGWNTWALSWTTERAAIRLSIVQKWDYEDGSYFPSFWERTASIFRVDVDTKVSRMKYFFGKRRKFEGNFGQLKLLKFKKFTKPMGVESWGDKCSRFLRNVCPNKNSA